MSSRPARSAGAGLPDYDFRLQVGHLLRRAYQRHVAIFQELAADPGLTTVQFVTLCTLHENGPSSQSELVRATAVDQGTIRGIIGRLRSRRLVKVSHIDADRRKVIVAITPLGERMVAAMVPQAKQITEATFGELDPGERETLLSLLRKMIA